MEALKGINALICIGKFNEQQISSFESITKNIIFVDMKTSKIHCNTIALDFRQTVIDAMDYLTNLGHKHIAYLGGKEYLEDGNVYFEERKETFVNYCKLHNIIYEPYLLEQEFSAESGYQMMMELIKNHRLPTAVFAASDPIAIGTMHALYENGYKVPTDISIKFQTPVRLTLPCSLSIRQTCAVPRKII